MGCCESKSVEVLNSDINKVFQLSPSDIDNTKNGESKTTDLADRIRNKKNKNSNNTKNRIILPRITSKYEIKAEIGRGKMTRVMRVENKITKKPFALKILNKMEGLETLECEISILRRLEHPHIINLIEVFVSEHRKRPGGSVVTAVVLELTTGGDLFDRLIAVGPFGDAEAVKVSSLANARVFISPLLTS